MKQIKPWQHNSKKSCSRLNFEGKGFESLTDSEVKMFCPSTVGLRTDIFALLRFASGQPKRDLEQDAPWTPATCNDVSPIVLY